jgi:tetratricopeptide (TPR) repeat protein
VTRLLKFWLLASLAGAVGALAVALRIFATAGPLVDWGTCNRNAEDARAVIKACSVLLQTNLKPKQRARALATRAFYSNELGGDADISLADLFEAIRLDPSSADAFNNRGLTYSRLQQYEQAIADFTRAIELSPRPRTYDSRGRAYFKARDYASALVDFSRSIEIDPEFAKAWRHRGEVRGVVGDYEGAKQDLMTALRLRPGYKPAQQALDRLDQVERTTPAQTETLSTMNHEDGDED